MSRPFVFHVTGTPRPLPRGRHVKGRVVSVADPKAKLWRTAVERAVRLAVVQSGRAVPLFAGAVRLHCTFVFAPPASQAQRIGTAHTHKPDASNLLKLVEDVMEAAGVFRNDSQVAEPIAIKRWGERAGLMVLVEDMSDDRPAVMAGDASPPDWLMQALGLRA